MTKTSQTFFPLNTLFLSGLLLSCIFYPKQERSEFQQTSEQAQEPLIRVLLRKASNLDQIQLKILGPYKIVDEEGNELYSGEDLPSCKVVASGNTFQFGNRFQISKNALRVLPLDSSVLHIQERFYRGELLLSIYGGKVQSVLELPLESYLLGVVGSEMKNTWNPACLASQAVIARTYAYNRYYRAKEKNYHLDDTVSSQVFHGMETENERVLQVVQETRGQILTYGGVVLPAYYHSTCGGATTSATGVGLEHKDKLPLLGVPCEYCKMAQSKWCHWETRLSEDEILYGLESLSKAPLSAIESILPQKIDASGRCEEIRVLFKNRTSQNYKSTDFRRVIGYKTLPGLRLKEIRSEGKDFIFVGGGFGHGVGLCQMGAKGMGEEGFNYQDILYFYYPGVSFERKW
jgi:stage II sporulation protein D